MAVEASQPLKIGHLIAAEDLSANQYKFVKINPNGTITASTDHVGACGVQQDKPLAGDPVSIVAIGITKLVTTAGTTPGGAIGTVGTWLSVQGGAGEIGTAIINCVPAAVAGP